MCEESILTKKLISKLSPTLGLLHKSETRYKKFELVIANK